MDFSFFGAGRRTCIDGLIEGEAVRSVLHSRSDGVTLEVITEAGTFRDVAVLRHDTASGLIALALSGGAVDPASGATPADPASGATAAEAGTGAWAPPRPDEGRTIVLHIPGGEP